MRNCAGFSTKLIKLEQIWLAMKINFFGALRSPWWLRGGRGKEEEEEEEGRVGGRRRSFIDKTCK